MSWAVAAEGITKRFGRITAVDDLSMKIREGTIYGLVGPNGSGKTTTVRMLTGVLSPDSGSIRVFGRPVQESKHRMGYMPQELAIYQDLTVEENLRFFTSIYGQGYSPEKAEDILEFVGLKERRESLTSTLSGGMQRRVSLACALCHSPDLIILDEPTVGVDPELRHSFWRHFYDIAREGKTIIITTHYMEEAGRCHRVGFMRHGKLIFEGTPGEVEDAAGTSSMEEAFIKLSGVGE